MAQIGAVAVYSLDDCLKISSSKNLDVQVAQAQLQTAAADITGAFGTFLPSLSANAGYSRRLNEQGGAQLNVGGFAPPSNSYSLGLNANYVIFNGFSREAYYDRAQKNLSVLESSNIQLNNQVRFNIWQQYIAVQRNAQIVKIRQENLEIGKKQLERSRARYGAGVVPVTDIYAQEADNGSRELDIVQAENQLNNAKAQLLATMGLDPAQNADFSESGLTAEISDEVLRNFRDETGSIDAIIQRAVAKRSDIIAADTRIEAAQATLRSSRSGYFPTVSAFGGWSWSNYEISDFDKFGRSFIGLNLNVPIFDNFSTNTQIETAAFQLKQAQIERVRIEQTIRTQAQSAVLNLVSAEKQLEVAKRALKSAELNLKSAQERFNVGTAQITDYLLANTQFATAAINQINAFFAYREAQAQIRFISGSL
ncbi:hypothetical protein MASR2M18_20470 [Ignavibacteria bacterium]